MLPYLFSLALAASLPAHAQSLTYIASGRALTLEQAQALALQRNPQLAAASDELLAADGAVQQAAMRPNPSLSFEVQDTRRATRETTMQFSQPLELGGKRAYRGAVAERARDSAALLLQARRAELRAAVTKAFYALLIAEERDEVANASMRNAERATLVASKRVQAGRISPVDEDKARVAESVIRLELLQAHSELQTARLRLAAQWGDRAALFARVAGSLDTLPEVAELTVLNGRLVDSPVVMAAQADVERQRALARLEQSRRLGDVAVSVGVKRSEELGRNQTIFGVSVPLPIFDRNQGAILESLRRVDKARDEAEAAALQAHGELAQAHATFTLARQQVAAMRGDILPRASRALDAATTGFEFGKFALLDVLDAQRTLLQTRSQYLQALGVLHNAAADIERLAPAPAHQATQGVQP